MAAHVIGEEYAGGSGGDVPLEDAVRKAVARFRGAYALVVMSRTPSTCLGRPVPHSGELRWSSPPLYKVWDRLARTVFAYSRILGVELALQTLPLHNLNLYIFSQEKERRAHSCCSWNPYPATRPYHDLL